MANDLKFAVLIDADNISDKYIKVILSEISNDGIATYKRIYGDWTNTQLNSWKSILLDNSIVPIQQYSYTNGKNSTDSAMIIDAMDILYTGQVNGFCIASSDSDFTRLAARLRESGMQVIGMGESKTPKPFIAACNQFKYLDILHASAKKAEKQTERELETKRDIGRMRTVAQEDSKQLTAKSVLEPQTDLATIKAGIQAIVEEGSDDDGWMFTGELGARLVKRYPDFDVRNYDYPKLTPFLKSLGLFDIKWNPTTNNNVKLVYVRLL